MWETIFLHVNTFNDTITCVSIGTNAIESFIAIHTIGIDMTVMKSKIAFIFSRVLTLILYSDTETASAHNFIKPLTLSWHSKPSPKNPSRHLHSYPPIVFEQIAFRLQSFSRSHSSMSSPGMYWPVRTRSYFQLVLVIVRFSPWIPGLYTLKAQSRTDLLVYLYNR